MTMNDPSRPPEDVGGREPTVGTPLWVKVFGVVALGLLLLALIVIAIGGVGGHGPGRHAASLLQP
jgi:hypothetical protein